eukprot:466609-Karenia_brevis.AAC.1
MPKLSDNTGRKCVLIASLVGSGVGYMLQGVATWIGKVPMWLVGRGVAGFFGGTQPVIKAYIVDISMHDNRLMKKRM